MENARVAKLLNEIADLLELEGADQFRVRSYRSAARTIDDLPERLQDMVSRGEDLTGLPNVGKSTAGKIREILDRGTCRRLEDLRKEVPQGLVDLLRVPRLGPRKAAQLHQALGVSSLEDLRKAAEEGRIRGLPGMGAKTEENILRGLKTLASAAGRILYHTAAQYAASLGRLLQETGSVEQWAVAGSFRRGKETVGDLDVLVQTKARGEVAGRVAGHETVAEVLGRGEEKVSIRLESGLQVDIRFFDPSSFGSALAYFTGSKAHNIALRKRAQAKDWKLNEYGLFKGEVRLAGATEESAYHRLGLPWIPPELREDRGEVEAAEEGRLPELVSMDHVKGDFHCHTSRTDGKNDLEEMIAGARERGYRFLAVTEHSKAVSVAGGLDEDAVRGHAERIRELDLETPDLKVMTGIEVDILKDGSLDLDEKVLADLDWVVASVHSYFDMDRDAMTGRLLAAVRSGVVHCLGHPLARIIGARDSVDFDMERVFEACREEGVSLEINAQPDRLDLPDIQVKMAKELGCRFALATDAHSLAELEFMRYGVMVARRGWLSPADLLNTQDPEEAAGEWL